MKLVYTGKEKQLHYKVVKDLIKENKIKERNISHIDFMYLGDKEELGLRMYVAEIYSCFEKITSSHHIDRKIYYTLFETKSDFRITFANLKKFKNNLERYKL